MKVFGTMCIAFFIIIISSRFHDPWIFFFLRGYVWVRNFEE